MGEEDIITYLATKGIMAQRLGEIVYIVARKQLSTMEIEVFQGFEKFEAWFLRCCANDDTFTIAHDFVCVK